jgi:Rrf2 family protein
MLSNTCKYGLRATIFIALKSTNGNRIGLKTISDNLNIPSPFLGKILQNLTKHKILSSTKGPHGGFIMGNSASEVSIMDIFEIIDGEDYFDKCLIGVQSCTDDPVNSPCPIHSKYSHIRDEISAVFVNTSIQDLADDINKADGIINI